MRCACPARFLLLLPDVNPKNRQFALVPTFVWLGPALIDLIACACCCMYSWLDAAQACIDHHFIITCSSCRHGEVSRAMRNRAVELFLPSDVQQQDSREENKAAVLAAEGVAESPTRHQMVQAHQSLISTGVGLTGI